MRKNPLEELFMRCTPSVTIGVCVKNAEETIKEAVQSMFDQDFPHDLIELIVVDGCSTDETLTIIKECLSKSDIKHKVFSEKDGLGLARQIIVDNADGDYIIWVDGDVILPNDHVRKQVDFMKQNPRVGIAAGRHEVCLEDGLVASLEDVSYVAVDFKYCGEVFSRLPGTAGSIYRVKAIRQVGGFDVHLRGVGEDIEAARRIREAGWLVYRGTEAVFYERRQKTWKGLWDHYFWYGYGAYSVIHKNRRAIELHKMVPIAGFLAGIWYSVIAFKLKRQNWVFLLPFHYAFKRIAWCLGFIKAYFDSWGANEHNWNEENS